jgi:hypothetical protein
MKHRKGQTGAFTPETDRGLAGTRDIQPFGQSLRLDRSRSSDASGSAQCVLGTQFRTPPDTRSQNHLIDAGLSTNPGKLC